MSLLNKYQFPLKYPTYQVLIGRDGTRWCVFLGNNGQDGFMAHGRTVKEALKLLANILPEDE